jgi:hypothetical protein
MKSVPSSRAQRACNTCHKRKERCDGGFPCNACRQRDIACLPRRATGSPHTEYGIDTDATASQRHPVINTAPASPKSSMPDSTVSSSASQWAAREYIDIYFNVFHPVWPFLHQGTFDLTREPCILVQSMVMIGLWIKGGQDERNAAIDLHHKLCSAIHTQMVSNDTVEMLLYLR